MPVNTFSGYATRGWALVDQSEGASQALSTSWLLVPLDADDGNYLQNGGRFPRQCHVQDVEIHIESMSTGTVPTTITIGLFRTANLDFPFVDYGATGATKTISAGTTVNTGSVVIPIQRDHYPVASGLSGATVASTATAPYDAVVHRDADQRAALCRTYLGIKLDQGTATLTWAQVTWRGDGQSAA